MSTRVRGLYRNVDPLGQLVMRGDVGVRKVRVVDRVWISVLDRLQQHQKARSSKANLVYVGVCKAHLYRVLVFYHTTHCSLIKVSPNFNDIMLKSH